MVNHLKREITGNSEKRKPTSYCASVLLYEATRKQKEEEEKRIAEERQREEKLEIEFNRLQQEEKEKIEAQAKANLISQGMDPKFILSPLLRIERNNILEKQLR
ncbi:MAG: hypothetical protein ABIK26_04795 [Candidatus Omnitrophota bacterium]